MSPQRQSFALDYIDVATRIQQFRDRYPDGALQQVSLQFVDFGGASWVVYTAAAYRSPDDTRPGHGTAWEQVPGATNFTRGSEVQNAETAAWGRAIIAALAGDARRGIASAEEVRNARERQDSDAAGPDPIAALRIEIAEAAKTAGVPLDTVAEDYAADHDGQPISAATDTGWLTLRRDELRNR